VRRTLTPKPATASSHMVNSLQLDLSASNHPLGDSLRGHWLARSAMGGSTGAAPHGKAPEIPDGSVGAKTPATSGFLSLPSP
jgi:hypothetical protein